MLTSPLNKSADAANQTLCGTLSQLFTVLLTDLTQAVSRSGGVALAEEFEQRVNRYADQHGWRVLTGMARLSDVREPCGCWD